MTKLVLRRVTEFGAQRIRIDAESDHDARVALQMLTGKKTLSDQDVVALGKLGVPIDWRL